MSKHALAPHLCGPNNIVRSLWSRHPFALQCNKCFRESFYVMETVVWNIDHALQWRRPLYTTHSYYYFLEELGERDWADFEFRRMTRTIDIATFPLKSCLEGRSQPRLLQWLLEQDVSSFIGLIAELYFLNQSPLEAWEYFSQIRVKSRSVDTSEGRKSVYHRYISFTNKREGATMTDETIQEAHK